MDDTSIKDSLSGFEEVWQRVGGGPDPENAAVSDAAPGEAERLRAFMVSAANAAVQYSSLARRFKSAASLLNLLAAEERSHLRALSLEYYLLTGDTFIPKPGVPETDGLLSILRRAWQAEGRSEQSYLSASAISPLGPLYRAHAENERRHRSLLRGLIARTLQ